MSGYSEDSKWDDVVPIPQDDGGPNPLAAISYTPGYAEAMSYLRAVMAANETSGRALDLTEDIISMNPAHYTVWLYRARILRNLHLPLSDEIEWLNSVALAHQKNYQIWHHRQYLLDEINDPAGEIAFVNAMLRGDAKNYHVWSYRQWLVRRFGMWGSVQENGRAELDDEDGQDEGQEAPGLVSAGAGGGEGEKVSTHTTELEETEIYIGQDVRNNSAWNHRFFIVNGDESAAGVRDQAICDREVKFAQEAVRKAPQNQSPWNYIRGTVTRSKGKDGLQGLKGFCQEFVDLSGEGEARSSHALDLLAEIYGREGEVEKARRGYELLAGRYDPIRVGYWNWLKGRLDEGTVAA